MAGYVTLSACISLALISLTLASDLFDSQLGDIAYCKRQCKAAFRERSAVKHGPTLNACHRGCRLFSICGFVNGNADFNSTKSECESACLEAYSTFEEQDGCVTGCRSQPTEEDNRSQRFEAMAQEPSLLSVMDLVSNWCSEIVSSAQSFISSTWTFYLQSDDGKVVVFQSEPEMAFAAPEVQAPRSDVAEKDWPPADVSTLNPQTRQQEKPDKDSRIVGKLKHMLQHSDDAQFKHDFLGCMSRSGLPRWILAACLFLSIIVMLWLSCASLVTAPDQHIKTQLSINGDKEFLDDVKKVAPYILTPVIAVAVSQSDDGEEAGPLPVKVDLDKTVI
ncbi:transmembrane protein 59-like isoform X2 [Erpetoichthys calabaricus]|uniref:transmembrane protein 59-like isoform X2 n=1 Tax=Erpetoichthys calabaricus TaxID=27687 RepID=UPI00109F6256|nr:transmembrane protein 59-like isoform X2 [Erpetoichthys calabaricus]